MMQTEVETSCNGNKCWDLVDYYMAPIRHLFDMPGVTEIMVNRYDKVFIEQHGIIKPAGAGFKDEDSVRRLIYQIANALGQVVDQRTHPILDARLLDETRVCAVLYPVAPNGNSITFRVFPKEHITAEFLIEKGSLSKDMLKLLGVAVLCNYNILVGGGTGSGKTTLLNVLLGHIPDDERILTVEDTRELRVDNDKHHLPLEAPLRRNKKDGQKVDLQALIKTTLRMRPSRIIVGEIRDAMAATAFLQAINTGHNAWSTIHANNPVDALTRIQTLVAGHGDLPFDVVKAQVRSNLNMIIHVEKTPRQGRRVVSITEIVDGQAVELWRWSYNQGRHVVAADSQIYKRLDKYGVKVPN